MGQLHVARLPITLDRRSNVPLYQQVQAQITELVLAGTLAPGARLPASRDLAIRLGVNRATVANAYDGLAAEGLVRSHVGQGTFVRDGADQQHAKTLAWPLSRAMEAAGRLLIPEAHPSEHPDAIDFASLIPDEELFPIEPFRKTVNTVLRRQGKQLLQYGPVPGYPPLRRYIADRLAERKVEATAEQVLIVNGSQQGLDLVFRALVNPGDTVAVESPTYTAVLPLLAQYQARVLGIPMTERGVDRQALEAGLASRPVRLIYTMPTFHNPTGITMDLQSRRALLNLAGRYGVPIVEDDFDSELRFDGAALPPIKALDLGGTVVYLGTFSKGLFPGLRLGWIVAPSELVGILGRAKMCTDYHTSQLLQAAILEFCERGHYDEHLKNLARVNRKKSRLLMKAMSEYFPEDVSWTEPEGGYACWITLPRHVSSEVLLTEGARAGVLFSPGSRFFTGGDGQQFLRLSISRVPADRIDEGVQRLGKLIERYISREPQRAPQSVGEPVFHI